MRIGIDASNIRAGGGITHLAEFLGAAQPEALGIDAITVWTNRDVHERLPHRPGISLVHEQMLDGTLPQRILWQYTRLPRLAASAADALFVPGGTYLGSFRPFVTMAQNLLPFDRTELRRLGWSRPRARLETLRETQARTFRRANGVVFPSHYIEQQVNALLHGQMRSTAVIPHGLNPRFLIPPRPQLAPAAFSEERPFKLLYVSIVNVYKHQWRIANAVAELRASGIPLTIDFIGPATPNSLRLLQSTIRQKDPAGAFMRYRGPVPFEELHREYGAADGFVFASTCESFGQILLEAMAAGLPIACSDRGPLPEILGQDGFYFDPLNHQSAVAALRELFVNRQCRTSASEAAYRRAQQYSWTRCADSTLRYIQYCAQSTVSGATGPITVGNTLDGDSTA